MPVIRCANIEDAAGIARVRAESWRTAYRGIVSDEFLDAIDVSEWSERQRRNMANTPPELVSFVANVEEEVVGWTVGGPNRDTESAYTGELYAIYLLPEYQRHGIGRKLTAATAIWLIGEGLHSMIVWTLAETGRPDVSTKLWEASTFRNDKPKSAALGCRKYPMAGQI